MKHTLRSALIAVFACGILPVCLPVHAQPATDLAALAPDQPPDRSHVRVSEVPLAKTEDSDKRVLFSQQIILDNGLRRFGLHKVDALYKPNTVPMQSVGWNIPDEGNWYHGGMFTLRVNGQNVNVGKSTFAILESGPRGVADFTLDNQFGKFRCRFIVIPNSEVLFADFAIEPVAEVKSLTVQLHNYPSTYQATREGKRHRQVLDAAGTLEPQTQAYSVDPAANWWFFYQDAIFDKDVPEYRERTYGPSALVLPSGEAQKVHITVGAYEVPTVIEYAPDRRHFRLACFDYFGLGNKAAQARFAKERDQVRATLDGMVFVPQRLRKARSTLAQISAQGITGEVAATVPELKQLLSALPEGNPWPQKAVTTEDCALQLLDQYDKTRWAVVKKQRPGIGVLVMRGLHWRYWGLDEAHKALGGQLRETAVSHYAEYYWKGEDISYFPATWEEMSRFDVIVFANVPFTVLGAERSKALAEFIQAGGSVLLLSGTHACGQGGIDQPPLGPLMPVQPTQLFDVRAFDKPQPIARAKDAPSWLSEGLDWKATPTALWYQQVNVAPAGKAWLTAGGKPLLIAGTAGSGRVAALCAPPYGEPEKGVTAFWEWRAWPSLMARLLLWLGRKEQ